MLARLLEELPNLEIKKKVWFIESAADVYKNKSFVLTDRQAFLEKWFEIIDIDLRYAQGEKLEQKLQKIDIIFVSGWNTFYLLEKMQKSWLDTMLKWFLKQWKIYIGSSAGSIILWNSIEHVRTLDDPSISSLEDYTGLNIFDKKILPHYGSKKYLEKMNKIIAIYPKEDFITIWDDDFYCEICK